MQTNFFLFIIVGLLLGFISCDTNSSSPQAHQEVVEKKPPLWGEEIIRLDDSLQLALDSLVLQIKSAKFGQVDELLIMQSGKVISQEHFVWNYDSISHGKTGKMGCGWNSCSDSSQIEIYNYYHPKYHPYYLDQNIHSLQSISKSIVSTIYGIALERGDLTSLDLPVYPFVASYLQSEALIQHYKNTSIKDLLMMRAGLAWEELGQSLEEDSDVALMERSEDWLAYVLNVSAKVKADSLWNYNSGASLLLGYIFQKEVGISIDEYAQKWLFSPLDIKNYYWKKTSKRQVDTEGGLYLSALDLAKIGQLYLQEGQWQDSTIFSKDWAKISTQKHSLDIYADGGKEGYGYQWWLTAADDPMIVGLGYGQQILIIDPKKEVVVVLLSWNVFDQKHDYVISALFNFLSLLK